MNRNAAIIAVVLALVAALAWYLLDTPATPHTPKAEALSNGPATERKGDQLAQEPRAMSHDRTPGPGLIEQGDPDTSDTAYPESPAAPDEAGREAPPTRQRVWQRRDEWRKLPVGEPRRPDISVSARGLTEAHSVARRSPSSPPPWTGTKRPSWDNPKRLVRGRVFEIRGVERIPMAGVMILDWQHRHRTFSDAEGRFEFEAYWNSVENNGSTQSAQHPETGSTYKVYLSASTPGFIQQDRTQLADSEGELDHRSRGEWYYEKELTSGEGAEIYIAPIEDEMIEVRLANVGLAAGDVTVILGTNDTEPGRPSLAEAVFVSTVADRSGRALFSVPPGLFRLRGVAGDGVRCLLKSCVRTQVSRKLAVIDVPLEACLNYLAKGVITDRRDGKPIEHAIVRGADHAEVAFSNGEGAFAIWLSRIPREPNGSEMPPGSQRLSFTVDGYLRFSTRADHAAVRSGWEDTAKVAPGGDETGPWQVEMSPWVKVHVSIDLAEYQWNDKDFAVLGGGNGVTKLEEGVRGAIKLDGTIAFELLPWGLTEFMVFLYGGERRGPALLRLAGGDWHGPGPYKLTFSQP